MMIRFLLAQGALFALLLFACGARAEPTETDRATARELAADGYRALKSGDYATAADRFQRADALVHAPTLLVDWGRALVGLELLVEAGEKYALVIREGIEPGAPPSWHRAHTEARSELEALKPRLAWLTLVVSGAEAPVITFDRARVPKASLGVPRATNPGTHQIRVQATGYQPALRTVTLVEGQRKRIEIPLVPGPRGSVAADPPEPLPDPQPAPQDSGGSSTRRTLTYTAFAVGGAGLIVGGVTGALALDRRSELESACSGDICPPSERDAIDSYQALGIASGISFGVAALGIGTGITLLLTEQDQGPRDTSSARGSGVWPYVGAGTIGAKGRF